MSACGAIVETASAFHKQTPRIPNRHLCLLFVQPFFCIMKTLLSLEQKMPLNRVPGNETLHKQCKPPITEPLGVPLLGAV